MTIWERVKNALTPLGLPMAQGSYQGSADQLPSLFLVYKLVSNPPLAHADNREIACSFQVQVNAYTRGDLADLPDVDSAMKAAGFKRMAPTEIPFNPATGLSGLSLEYTITESKL